MTFRRFVATCAFALVVVVMTVPPADAQGRGGRGGRGGGGGGFGRGGSPFTPEAGARDMKSVLFNWTWHMGMLRGEDEPELILTLEYQGNGTMQVDGQPCTLSKYRISANYRVPGYRTQIECTMPNGETYSNVETMSGDYAWDEDIPGAELVPGEGKATPKPGMLEERRIRLWASPHGAPKAAIAAATGLPLAESFAKNPATLVEQQEAAGAKSTAKLSWQGDKAIVTYPIPGVPGAMATATLDETFLPESVIVKHGSDTYEFDYGDYKDTNNPLHRIETIFPGTWVERKNGKTVRDIKTVVTEIGQVYVIVPVPDSVRKAGAARN